MVISVFKTIYAIAVNIFVHRLFSFSVRFCRCIPGGGVSESDRAAIVAHDRVSCGWP